MADLANPPAFASGPLSIDAEALAGCVGVSGASLRTTFVNDVSQHCIGEGIKSCLRSVDPSGGATFDRPTYLGCIGLEHAFWMWRLDRVADGLKGTYADTGTNEFPKDTVPELDALLITWRAYAAVKCSYETSQYGFGASRGREGGIVEQACLNSATARLAIDLEFRLRSHCDSRLAPNYGTACDFDA